MIGNSPALAEALGRFEGLYPETIELSLGRVLNALESLGRPQDRLPPVIHVAGTNGKGSTCAFMRAMMEAAGLSVHVFTSPHLVRFNERIRLAGEIVDDVRLIDWLERTYDAIKGQEITQFEATTATALLAFSEVPADVLILEVGLGGSYDATNVIDQPALSVITPIDFDHKAFLGSDIRKIAGEKAGIIKSGRPALTAIQRKICDDVIAKRAEDVGAPLYRLKAHFIDAMPEDLGLLGEHQRANAALAAMAVQLFGNSTIIGQNAIFEGARNVVWPARMQRLKDGPLTALAPDPEIWLDGGHNADAGRMLGRHFSGRSLHLIIGMLESKDPAAIITPLEDSLASISAVAVPGHDWHPPEAFGDQAAAQSDVAAALASLPEDGLPVLIAGSLYLAGDVLRQNGELPD